MQPSTRLRELLGRGQTLVMPDAYDPLSARIIEKLGFEAVQCSGFSMALAACEASEAAFGLERNLAITRSICGSVSVPVMADGEDGFGDETAIPATIRRFLEAGVAGINLEDQVLGQPGPKRIIPLDQALAKLRAARLAGGPDLILNARTDALAAAETAPEGLAEAVRRSNAYLQAGGDLAFVVGVSTLDQVALLVREIDGPVSIAAGMPNSLGNFSIAQLRDCGVARVSLPSLMVFSAIQAMQQALTIVREDDGFERIIAGERTCDMAAVQALLQR